MTSDSPSSIDISALLEVIEEVEENVSLSESHSMRRLSFPSRDVSRKRKLPQSRDASAAPEITLFTDDAHLISYLSFSAKHRQVSTSLLCGSIAASAISTLQRYVLESPWFFSFETCVEHLARVFNRFAEEGLWDSMSVARQLVKCSSSVVYDSGLLSLLHYIGMDACHFPTCSTSNQSLSNSSIHGSVALRYSPSVELLWRLHRLGVKIWEPYILQCHHATNVVINSCDATGEQIAVRDLHENISNLVSRSEEMNWDIVATALVREKMKEGAFGKNVLEQFFVSSFSRQVVRDILQHACPELTRGEMESGGQMSIVRFCSRTTVWLQLLNSLLGHQCPLDSCGDSVGGQWKHSLRSVVAVLLIFRVNEKERLGMYRRSFLQWILFHLLGCHFLLDGRQGNSSVPAEVICSASDDVQHAFPLILCLLCDLCGTADSLLSQIYIFVAHSNYLLDWSMASLFLLCLLETQPGLYKSLQVQQDALFDRGVAERDTGSLHRYIDICQCVGGAMIKVDNGRDEVEEYDVAIERALQRIDIQYPTTDNHHLLAKVLLDRVGREGECALGMLHKVLKKYIAREGERGSVYAAVLVAIVEKQNVYSQMRSRNNLHTGINLSKRAAVERGREEEIDPLETMKGIDAQTRRSFQTYKDGFLNNPDHWLPQNIADSYYLHSVWFKSVFIPFLLKGLKMGYCSWLESLGSRLVMKNMVDGEEIEKALKQKKSGAGLLKYFGKPNSAVNHREEGEDGAIQQSASSSTLHREQIPAFASDRGRILRSTLLVNSVLYGCGESFGRSKTDARLFAMLDMLPSCLISSATNYGKSLELINKIRASISVISLPTHLELIAKRLFERLLDEWRVTEGSLSDNDSLHLRLSTSCVTILLSSCLFFQISILIMSSTVVECARRDDRATSSFIITLFSVLNISLSSGKEVVDADERSITSSHTVDCADCRSLLFKAINNSFVNLHLDSAPRLCLALELHCLYLCTLCKLADSLTYTFSPHDPRAMEVCVDEERNVRGNNHQEDTSITSRRRLRGYLPFSALSHFNYLVDHLQFCVREMKKKSCCSTIHNEFDDSYKTLLCQLRKSKVIAEDSLSLLYSIEGYEILPSVSLSTLLSLHGRFAFPLWIPQCICSESHFRESKLLFNRIVGQTQRKNDTSIQEGSQSRSISYLGLTHQLISRVVENYISEVECVDSVCVNCFRSETPSCLFSLKECVRRLCSHSSDTDVIQLVAPLLQKYVGDDSRRNIEAVHLIFTLIGSCSLSSHSSMEMEEIGKLIPLLCSSDSSFLVMSGGLRMYLFKQCVESQYTNLLLDSSDNEGLHDVITAFAQFPAVVSAIVADWRGLISSSCANNLALSEKCSALSDIVDWFFPIDSSVECPSPHPSSWRSAFCCSNNVTKKTTITIANDALYYVGVLIYSSIWRYFFLDDINTSDKSTRDLGGDRNDLSGSSPSVLACDIFFHFEELCKLVTLLGVVQAEKTAVVQDSWNTLLSSVVQLPDYVSNIFYVRLEAACLLLLSILQSVRSVSQPGMSELTGEGKVSSLICLGRKLITSVPLAVLCLVPTDRLKELFRSLQLSRDDSAKVADNIRTCARIESIYDRVMEFTRSMTGRDFIIPKLPAPIAELIYTTEGKASLLTREAGVPEFLQSSMKEFLSYIPDTRE